MDDNLNMEDADEYRKSIINSETIAAICHLIIGIDMYVERYLDMSDDEILELIQSEPYCHISKTPDFPTCSDRFIILALHIVIKRMELYKIEMTEEETGRLYGRTKPSEN